MSDFIVAIGMVLAIEGILFAAIPGTAKRMAAHAAESPELSLRTAGLISALIGVVLIWLIRGT
jgi:uncharacterized protein YjeT (DUF2065 family)